jgi:hypothetical protein
MIDQNKAKSPHLNLFTTFWFLPALIFYGLVFWRSLVFVYIEGDDATSIAYHLLGRNPGLQLPYSPYQGMMDTVMSLLPAQEQLLRITGMGLSALACVLLGYLISRLIFMWNPNIPARVKSFIPILILLAAPELFYLGLSYKPTLLAIDLLLCSHLILRSEKTFDLLTTNNKTSFILSLVLFALGVSFRWNTIVYGAVIVTDVFFVSGLEKGTKKKIMLTGLWGGLALVFSVIAIVLSNLNVLDLSHAFTTLQSVVNQVGTEGSNAYLTMLLALSPLFTPGMVIASIIGFILLVRRKDKMWIVVAIGLIGVLPFFRIGSPKNLITFIPELAFCLTIGFGAIWNFCKFSWKNYAFRVAILAIIFIPWIIGVRAVWGDTAWGPAFELKPFDRPESDKTEFYLVTGTGSAFPTPGIPRPIYGYFDNLIGGRLKDLELTLSDERSNDVETAIMENLPIVMTGWTPDYFVIELYKKGYITKDGAYHESSIAKGFYDRILTNQAGHSVYLFHSEISDRDGAEVAQKLSPLEGQYEKVILIGYPSSMRALYSYCPKSMVSLGSKSAVVDLITLKTNRCNTN